PVCVRPRVNRRRAGAAGFWWPAGAPHAAPAGAAARLRTACPVPATEPTGTGPAGAGITMHERAHRPPVPAGARAEEAGRAPGLTIVETNQVASPRRPLGHDELEHVRGRDLDRFLTGNRGSVALTLGKIRQA